MGPELLELMHSAGDLVAGIVTALLAWAALFVLGPLLCACIVALRAAGHAPPADAAMLFYGTAGAWGLALACSVVTRAARSVGAMMRRSKLREAHVKGRKAADDIRRAPRPATAQAPPRARRPARRRGQGVVPPGPPPARGPREAPRRTPPPPPRPAVSPPVPETDPLAVLGLPKGATQDAVRRAYRDLVKKYHPDRVMDLPPEFRKVAHQKTMEIRRAYEALTRSRGPG